MQLWGEVISKLIEWSWKGVTLFSIALLICVGGELKFNPFRNIVLKLSIDLIMPNGYIKVKLKR